jgi:putative ABC transport system ATP-binding protein
LVVSIEDLSFHYDEGTKPVLQIPHWQVQRGERIFLHGPSGSGKSTLLNLLAGVLLPSSGSIEVLGKSLNRLSGRQRDKLRARHVGVVFQQFNLIPYLNAVENIKLAGYFAGTLHGGETGTQLLNALGIASHLHSLPAGRLSIGQQQRVAIARALVNQPELLIVDEPTSALDNQNSEAFMTLLLDQVEQHDTALIFVSHDQSLASAFTRVEALDDINLAGGSH